MADSPAGSLALASGQSAVAERGKAPVTQVVARPRDAVHWALYYPPVVYFRPDEFTAGPGWPGAVRASLEARRRAISSRRSTASETSRTTVSDPRFFAHRASLLLAVGRVDEAGADIQRALSCGRTTRMPWRSRRSSRSSRTRRTGRSRSPSRRFRRRPSRPRPESPCPTRSRPGSTWKAREPVSRRP